MLVTGEAEARAAHRKQMEDQCDPAAAKARADDAVQKLVERQAALARLTMAARSAKDSAVHFEGHSLALSEASALAAKLAEEHEIAVTSVRTMADPHMLELFKSKFTEGTTNTCFVPELPARADGVKVVHVVGSRLPAALCCHASSTSTVRSTDWRQVAPNCPALDGSPFTSHQVVLHADLSGATESISNGDTLLLGRGTHELGSLYQNKQTFTLIGWGGRDTRWCCRMTRRTTSVWTRRPIASRYVAARFGTAARGRGASTPELEA